ncbi:hypothetical protein [Nostoc sp.]
MTNVTADDLGAFADNSDHFLHWLENQAHIMQLQRP